MSKTKDKSKNTGTLSWLVSSIKGKRRYIVLLTVVEIVAGLNGAAYALMLEAIINCAAARDSAGFRFYAIALLSLVMVQVVLRWLTRHLEEYTKAITENRLKHKLFDALLRKDYAAVTGIHSGEWLNRLTSDAGVVTDGLVMIVPGVTGMMTKLLSSFLVLIALDFKFGFAILVGGGLIVSLTLCFRKGLKQLHRRMQEEDGKVRIFLSEWLGSMLMVRAFDKQDTASERADALMENHKKARMKKAIFSNLCNTGFGAAMSGAYILSAIYCCGKILAGTMSYGTLTAVMQLISQIQAPAANISAFLPKYYAMLASGERLMEAERFADDCPDGIRSDSNDFYKTQFQGLGLRDASFTYPVISNEETSGRQPKVLRHLDIQIRKGEYVAFTGPSGCGKSTVLKLLMSLYHLDSGQRYLDTADGELPLTSQWRSLFAYVPQGNHLVSGTIREVIAFGDRTAMKREADIRRALEIACADRFIDELKDGIDTVLAERGSGLSEGQMQRIAIARALFSDRPILLLDEATSALDDQTERQVLVNLRTMTDKTVLIVTHRPAALDITDKVIAFSDQSEISDGE